MYLTIMLFPGRRYLAKQKVGNLAELNVSCDLYFSIYKMASLSLSCLALG